MKKAPSLLKNPKLAKKFDRERWIQEAFDRNGSESARESRKNVVSRLTHYSKKVHGMIPEDVFEWMKKESKKDSEVLTQYAIDFLSKYVKFCKQDHKDIIINRGSNPEKNRLNKNNYLHKLHDNSISIQVARSRVFMSQVGGIRIHNDDMKRVPIPVTVKKGLYDDEEAEPLTAEQARNVIEAISDNRARVLYNFMNDTGFRITEAGMVKDSDFDLYADPPSVKTPSMSVKGVKTRGVRYLRKKTAFMVKTLFADNDDHFTFRCNDTQNVRAFRVGELKKIKRIYRLLGMTQVYEDTGRSKYNLHSWRKRCGTEYARKNNESLADGYLRHTKYLAQYHLKTKEERIEAFRRAEFDLAIDESEKHKVKIKALENEKDELLKLKTENSMLKEKNRFRNMIQDELKKLGIENLKPVSKKWKSTKVQ